jgi:hypothetical protein
MYDLATIQAMNRDASRIACQKNLVPYVVWEGDKNLFPPFPFPKLGDYIPKGWKKVNEYFCDSSGLGSEDEPALTIREFKNKLVVGRGYAITSEGQFQVYVGEYIRS